MKKVTDTVFYAGVNDHQIDLFEGQYRVPHGMAYNSYVMLDEKIAVFDTVDIHFAREWLDNVQEILGDRKPDYLVVHHMEPDHSANIARFMELYPDTTIVGNVKTFSMMKQFFGTDYADHRLVVKDGGTLSLGQHNLTFVFAPMVHWPEVMVTYDAKDKLLFTADGFGKFGALDVDEPWADEARRYYIGIVGKYGMQVQALLKKAAALDIEKILPLHGPVLEENLGYYIGLYDAWSAYRPEAEGAVVAYTSVYGHTKEAAELAAEKLRAKGCPEVVVYDLARCDVSAAVSDAFRYSKLVLATTTYNMEIYPFMKFYIDQLTERNFQNRTVALIENGTWAPAAAKIMQGMFEKSKNITFTEPVVHIKSAMTADNRREIEAMTDELCREYASSEEEEEPPAEPDFSALNNIGYGLYVLTTNDGTKDNGMIVNTVTQVTNNPNRIAVTVNKANYSCEVIQKTGKMNINCLSTEAPFSVFECFGFRSGRDTDKLEGWDVRRSANGLVYLPKYINAYMSLDVEKTVDFDTHVMFVCTISAARVVSEAETMSYTYYHQNVKPQPQLSANPGKKKRYVCKICGYVYEGDELPADFVCPLCKHGAADFELVED